MITPEQLIYNLQQENAKLQQELADAEKHIADFEKAAHEWKKGYADMERSYRIKLQNAQKTIEQLLEELDLRDDDLV